jgi:hypothetical protein
MNKKTLIQTAYEFTAKALIIILIFGLAFFAMFE